MSKRRKLTPDEKQQIEAKALAQAYEKYPNGSVEIVVEDEIDDAGKVYWRTIVLTEEMMSDAERRWKKS